MTEATNAAGPPWASGELPDVLTYVYPEDGGVTYQLQWDYQIQWPNGGRPTIKLLGYRSFQRNRETRRFEPVEQVFKDIPVNHLIMMNISKHAAGYLYAYAELEGKWRFADRTFFDGCAEAAKKRFSLASYRQMAQADPNPSL